jgi:Na+/proline symporter
MAKKKRKQTDEESREETRKEKRIKARDRERNRKIYLGTAVVLGLVILVLLIGFITATAVSTKKYMRSVADFLSANRCAGKYLLGVADGVSGLGAVSIIAIFEMTYKAGFTASWWKLMLLPVRLN